MLSNNNKWVKFDLRILFFLLLLPLTSPAALAATDNINGIPVDLAVETQLDTYLNTMSEEDVDSKTLLFNILASFSEKTPIATRVRAKSYEIFWYYYEGETELAFEKVEELLALAGNSELADVKAEAQATQIELLQAEGKSGEAYLLISEMELVLSQARMPRVRYYAHNLISRIYTNWNRYDDALKHLLAAQQAVSETDNDRTLTRKQYLHYSIARIQAELKNWSGSLKRINDAIELANKNNLVFDLPDFYLHKSYVQAGLGDREASLKSLQRAYKVAVENDREALLTVILNNFGDHYMYNEEWVKARNHFLEALEIAEKINDKYMVEMIHFNLGFIDVRQGNTESGLKDMQDTIQFYREEGRKTEVEKMLGELAQAFEFVNQYANEASALKEQMALKQELYQNEQQQNLANLQHLYESKDKEQQIELLERQNKLKLQLLEINEQRNLIWLLLGVVAVFASIFIFLLYRKARRANLKLKAANNLLADQSRRDPLTGLWNRRALQEEMETRKEHGERRATSALSDGLILLDIDFFKRINDKYGHAAGDKVLIEISRRLQKECRASDKLIRWGGEEFLFLVRNIDGIDIEEMSGRILTEVAKAPIVYDGKEIFITATIGFIRLPFGGVSEEKMGWEKVLQVADMALYTGKTHGRNRACGVTELHVDYETARTVLESDLSKAVTKKWISVVTIEGPQTAQDNRA